MPSSTTPPASSPTRTSPCSTPNCAERPSRSLKLEQHQGVDGEEDREEDRRAVEVALDHRAAAEGAAPAADAEGAGETGVFARVQEDQEDQDPCDQNLDYGQKGVHGPDGSDPARCTVS